MGEIRPLPCGNAEHHRRFRVPARLPVDLRPGGGGARRRAHRRGAWRRGQQLHRRGDLREGRRATPNASTTRPADASAAAHRTEGPAQFRRISWDEALDRIAERFIADTAKHGTGSGLAVLLCRHDGAGAARRHQPAAPRHALLAAEADDLHLAAGDRLAWPGSARAAAPTRGRWRSPT